MRFLKAHLMLVCALLCIGPVFAADALGSLDTIYDRCVKKHGTINNGVVEACSGEASDAAKKQINHYYQKAYVRLQQQSPDDAQKLEEAQKAWISYRDRHCSLAGSYVGSPMYSYCPMQLNIARVHELQELAGE